jgi:hypothetical protein
VLLGGLVIAGPALAGPPLLCRPFDIGTALSLPWNATGNPFAARDDYKVDNLVGDTQALLTPSTPILVRMETLRRAAIYAGRDPRVAEALLAWAIRRAAASEKAGHADALAFLDAAYVTEALREIGEMGRSSLFGARATAIGQLVGNADGYALVEKALAAWPDEPALEFAAALIAVERNRGAYEEHARRARAGAARDPLLARNIKQLS